MDIEALREIRNYAPHILTPEDRAALRRADLERNRARRVIWWTGVGVGAALAAAAVLWWWL